MTASENQKNGETNKMVSSPKKAAKTVIKAVSPSNRKVFTFAERLTQCQAFKDEFGHCKIPTTSKYDKSLGIWVQEMRRNFKLQMTTGKARRPISPEQIAQLDALGFHWGFKPAAGAPQSDDMWETSFEQARQYQEEHGNFDIPADYHDTFLAEWVCAQRDQKKRRDSKMKCNINKQRIQKLDDIGFNWDGPRKL